MSANAGILCDGRKTVVVLGVASAAVALVCDHLHVVVTRRDCWRHDCSATSATCSIFTTPTTVRSKACRQVRRHRSTEAAAMTTDHTAPLVKVCAVYAILRVTVT